MRYGYLTLTLGEGRYLLFRSSSSRITLMTPGTGTTRLRGRGRVQSGVGLGVGLEGDKHSPVNTITGAL